jgi:uncharacterized protein YkwD
MAMTQLSQSPDQASNLIDPNIKYVGVGMAYNNQSHNYYWSQVFSTGNYSKVNCTANPVIETINSQNITHKYTQPSLGLNYTFYPAIGLKDLKCQLKRASMEEMIQAAEAALGRPSAQYNATTEQQQKVASFLISAISNQTSNFTVPVNQIDPQLLSQVRLNMTLKAIRKAIRNDTSLQAGLNGTSKAAYNELYSQLQFNPSLTSIPGVSGNL